MHAGQLTPACAAPKQVKPLFKRVHSQHHQIGSAITTLGTAFGDAADIGLCFVAFHLVLGAYLYTRPAWNVAAVVLLILFEARWAALFSAQTDCCTVGLSAAPVIAWSLRGKLVLLHAPPAAAQHAPEALDMAL